MGLEARGRDGVWAPAAPRNSGVSALARPLPVGQDMGVLSARQVAPHVSLDAREGSGGAPCSGGSYSRSRRQHVEGPVTGQAMETRQQLPGGGRKGLGSSWGAQPHLHTSHKKPLHPPPKTGSGGLLPHVPPHCAASIAAKLQLAGAQGTATCSASPGALPTWLPRQVPHRHEPGQPAGTGPALPKPPLSPSHSLPNPSGIVTLCLQRLLLELPAEALPPLLLLLPERPQLPAVQLWTGDTLSQLPQDGTWRSPGAQPGGGTLARMLP